MTGEPAIEVLELLFWSLGVVESQDSSGSSNNDQTEVPSFHVV